MSKNINEKANLVLVLKIRELSRLLGECQSLIESYNYCPFFTERFAEKNREARTVALLDKLAALDTVSKVEKNQGRCG